MNRIGNVRVAAFGGGGEVPSTRFRLRQYMPALAHVGVEVVELSRRFGRYPPSERWLRRLPWAAGAIAEQAMNATRTWLGFDLVLLQREIISKLVSFEPLTSRPRILDVDDAIYLHRGGKPARRLASMADVVICGNSTLADWFSRHAREVVILPTPVDTDLLTPKARCGEPEQPFILGWIGTSGNLIELTSIEDALSMAMREIPKLVLRIVADRPPVFRELPPERVQFLKWSEAVEVRAIQEMDVGLMPLRDNPWNQGKCSFKMLQYLSCGVPAVVSPVGMNADVLRHGPAGIAVRTTAEWVEAIIYLARNPAKRVSMGSVGRAVAETHYSLAVLAPVLAGHIRRVANHCR